MAHPVRYPVIKILALGDSGVGKSTLLNYFTDGIFTQNFSSTVGVDFKDKRLVRRRRRLPSLSESVENQTTTDVRQEVNNRCMNNNQSIETHEGQHNQSDSMQPEFNEHIKVHRDDKPSEWAAEFPDQSERTLTPDDQSDWEEERVHIQLWDTAGQERFRSLTTTFFRDAMGFLLTFDLTHAQSLVNIQTWLQQLHAHAYNDDPALVLIGAKCDLVAERVVDRRSAERLAEGLGVGYYETSAVSGEYVCEAVYHLVDVILKKRKDEMKMKSRHISIEKERNGVSGAGIRVEKGSCAEGRGNVSNCAC